MRLQGGPLHVGWRCREHLVYVCVQPSGGAVDVPTIAANRLPLRRSPYYIPPFGYLFHGAVRLFHESGYLFHEAVTYSRRLRA